jgi:hypothetical protein
MKNLHLNIHPELIYYPIVDFNYQTGILDISGESYMEETYTFYEPVIHWIREFVAEGKPVIFNIKLTYFNTSSSRFILETIDILKDYKDMKGNVQINWYYKKDDPDMLNEIGDFVKETEMEINTSTFDKI